jgi:hypothetical protein
MDDPEREAEMNNPNDIWARPPFPDKGDLNEDVLFASVGRALTAWELFEADLAFLFAAFIVPQRDSEAARRAYGCVANPRGRAELIRGAASVYFRNFPNQDSEEALDTLLATAQRGAERRNDIAHGYVRPYLIKEPHPDPISWVLFPPYYNTKRQDSWGFPDYAYTSAHIDHFRSQFEGLKSTLSEVCRALFAPSLVQDR